MGSGELHATRQDVQDTLKTNTVQWNVKVQWNNIKKFVLNAAGDLVGKVDKKTRETWITQEITNKTEE